MAATSTNKQPLLVDHVLHQVVDLQGSTVVSSSGVDLKGTNNATLVIDATNSDGCIIEDIYAISRVEKYTIKLYLSTANDYLRPQQAIYIGQFESTSTTPGAVAKYTDMPNILAPMPHAGTEPQFKALYIPRGKTLWAAVEALDADDQALNAPLFGVQGGWY
jgi:hypothetical protein